MTKHPSPKEALSPKSESGLLQKVLAMRHGLPVAAPTSCSMRRRVTAFTGIFLTKTMTFSPNTAVRSSRS
jgi:hypothetical protein